MPLIQDECTQVPIFGNFKLRRVNVKREAILLRMGVGTNVIQYYMQLHKSRYKNCVEHEHIGWGDRFKDISINTSFNNISLRDIDLTK